ncbi:MAG: DUF2330 domain-containing protein [Methanoregulaceae archaeon]|nr:DUF2330 domain-containing protein [Methanoregulaceae archaeon]
MARRTLGAVAILLLMVVAQLGAADGGFFGKNVGAKLTIPDQRAIIVWNEGQQTLFVESNLRAAAGEYSWVIPLPAPPTEIGKARPSVMDLVFGELSPMVRARDSGERYDATMILCSTLLAALIVLRWRSGPRWHRLVLLFAIPAFVFILSPASTLHAAKSAAGGGDTVRVLDRQTIGSYDVSVVKSDDAKALVQWLDKAGTPLPDHARPVIESYIREGWCFMTARFRKDMAADAAPHPVRIKFPAEEPVYPMRLTGVVSDRLDLDLVVIGPKVAECPPLTLLRSRKLIAEKLEAPPMFNVRQSSFALRHADIIADLPDRGLATRLRSKLLRDQMQSDYAIEWKGDAPEMPQFFSERAARDRGIAAGLAAMSVFVLIGAGVGVFRPPTRARTFVIALLGLSLLAGAVGGVVTAATPTLITDEGRPARPESEAHVVGSCVRQAFEGAQTLDFDPFRVRFERGLRACAKASRSKSPPEAWLKDDVGGYLITETAKDEFEIQLMDAWGQIERMKFKDRVVTPSDPVVRTTVRLAPGPERLLDPARRAGILDWNSTRVEFTTPSGKVLTARPLKDGRFEVKLPAGEFRVFVKGHVLFEPVKWARNDTLEVPFQRSFTAQGEFDLSRHFSEQLGPR